jgi:hypothetical protein
MQFFPLVTFQEMVLAFFLGLGTVLLLYLAWGSYPKRPVEEICPEESPESPEPGKGREGADHPLPPFLIFIYAGVAVWILAYLIVIGLRVKAIG